MEPKNLNLFISSPGDVTNERDIVRKVASRLNQDRTLKVRINTVAWDDTNTIIPMLANTTPQAVINQEILRPSECEIVVVLFWSRIGTPLASMFMRENGTFYESGTEWEYEDAMRGSRENDGIPAVLVYRSNIQLNLKPDDPDFSEKLQQATKVNHFFSRFRSENGAIHGGYNHYSNLDEFEKMLEAHLRVITKNILKKSKSSGKPTSKIDTLERKQNVFDQKELLRHYLNWIIGLHSNLELRGIGGSVQVPTIPLEKVYVALKGNRKIRNREIEQSQQLFNKEMLEYTKELNGEISPLELEELIYFAERRAVIENPLMPSMTSRDRSHASFESIDETITLGDAFRRERWLVILGDPGSGKTTLARWLTLKLARAMLHENENVLIPAQQIDPNIEETSDQEINIGPARLPVLVRVSEFSNALKKAQANLGSLSLVDFLGHHSWDQQYPENFSPGNLNELIKEYLRTERAVIILDGMDEITEASQRMSVVKAIEAFINLWINAAGKSERLAGWNKLIQGTPFEDGGNQIIITSRVAGYHTFPISGEVTHVTIKSMQRRAVEHFCDAWCLAVRQLMYPDEDTDVSRQVAATESNGLKDAIFDSRHSRLRELASNPLLITNLALIFRNNRDQLPEHRVKIYENAMKILIDSWRISGLTSSELFYVLAPLAAHIHDTYAQGLIEESEMREIISRELAIYRQLDPEQLPANFKTTIDEFIRKVQEDVGLLAERSENIYGFLHLTFQEYLAALFLIRDRKNAGANLAEKMDDPRWREPILMALEHISMDSEWGPKARENLLLNLLNADDPIRELIPRAALLIVSAIPEMGRISENVINQILHRLFTAYADDDGLGKYSILRGQIEKGFNNLYASSHRKVLQNYLLQVIGNIANAENHAYAAASLLSRSIWHTQEITDALISALPYDDPNHDYPILNALLILATPNRVEKIEFLALRLKENEHNNKDEAAFNKIKSLKTRRSLLTSSNLLHFRRELEDNPFFLEIIRKDVHWNLIFALIYGGYSDHGFFTDACCQTEIESVLSLDENLRINYLNRLKSREYWQKEWEDGDMVYNVEVYLDQNGGKLAAAARKLDIRFDPAYIVNDSPLTNLFLSALSKEISPLTLVDVLWQQFEESNDGLQSAHALVALLVIDPQKAVTTIQEILATERDSSTGKTLFNLLGSRRDSLRNVVGLLGSKGNNSTWLKPADTQMPMDHQEDLIQLLYRTCSTDMPYPIPSGDLVNMPYGNAEFWAYYLSGYGNDSKYNFAVVLDTMGKKLTSANALTNIHRSQNAKYDMFTKWSYETIPPLLTDPPDVIGEALSIAQESHSIALGNLFSVGNFGYTGFKYQNYPGLFFDALSAALSLPSEEQAEVVTQIAQVETAGKNPIELIDYIVDGVLNIQDPVIHARAVWRAALALDYWKGLDLWKTAINTAEKITDPFHRSRAFERLINYLEQSQSQYALEQSENAAHKIGDPNNRSRSLVRLSFYHSDNHKRVLLRESFQAVQEITDERQLVELVLLFRKVINDAQFIHDLDSLLGNLKDSWLRKKATSLLSIEWILNHWLLGQEKKLIPISLASLMDDSLVIAKGPTEQTNLWKQLTDTNNKQKSLWLLLDMAAETNDPRLPLTYEAINAIQYLLDNHELSSIYELLPYLSCRDPKLFPYLRTWLETNPDRELRRYSGVMLAEEGQLDMGTIIPVLDVLESGVDVGRYRASLLLHGDMVFNGKPNKRYRTSQLGMNTMLIIGRAWEKAVAANNPFLSNVLSWTWTNIYHDDINILRSLAFMANEDGPDTKVAQMIIGRIDSLNDYLFEEFVKLAAASKLDAFKFFIKAWGNLIQTNKKMGRPTNYYSIFPGMKELVENTASEYQVIPDRCLTIAQTIIHAGSGYSNVDDAIKHLDMTLSNATITLSNTEFETLFSHVFFNWRRDLEQVEDAAEMIVGSNQRMELLFAWLNAELSADHFNSDKYFYKTDALLHVASYCAKLSPAETYMLINKYSMEDRLLLAATKMEWFFARASAIELLGYILEFPKGFESCLLQGLQDVAEVQSAVLSMVGNLRYLDKNMASNLIELLDGKDASTTYAITQILTLVGKNDKIDVLTRNQILNSLINLSKDSRSNHGVFVFRALEHSMYIQNVSKLNQVTYQSIIELTGLV